MFRDVLHCHELPQVVTRSYVSRGEGWVLLSNLWVERETMRRGTLPTLHMDEAGVFELLQ